MLTTIELEVSEMKKRTKLRSWREARGLTLEEIADLTGLSMSMLSRAETGQRSLKPMKRVTVARRLGVPIRELFETPKA